LQPIITAVGVFLLVLLLFKAPILLSQLGYSFGHKNNTSTQNTPVTDAAIPATNTITISKINVHAPVVYEPSVQEAAVQQALENGVVHYGNTPAPGQNGNVAIFGHSSNDWWEPGNYKFVFVLLDKLAPGDLVTIDYNQVRYTYQVTGSQIVDPTDVAVLNPTPTPTLTLITCSPPGTSLRRLVVTAKQISPDPSKATRTTPAAASATSSGGNLPSSAPSFLTQIQQAWNGVVQGFESVFGGGSSNGTGTSPSPSSSGSTPSQLPAIK
jgi:sortase A